MLMALSVKNKLGFVDRSFPKSAPQKEIINAYKRNNNIIVSWIINSISKEISSSIQFADSAETIWNHLLERFQQSNESRIFEVLRELVNLT